MFSYSPSATEKSEFEHELQALSSSLRQSWDANDLEGTLQALKSLTHLFPDLIPRTNGRGLGSSGNCYEMLKLKKSATNSEVTIAFFKTLRKVLRAKGTPNQRKSYLRILDAGLILRKPRLRLSHDLLAAAHWLSAHGVPSDNVVASNVVQTPVPAPDIDGQLPMMVQLLSAAGLIAGTEIQALLAQIDRVPELPVEVLILDAGYVTRQEMSSLILAQDLLVTKKLSMPQIVVALYDEHYCGVRMAESLQVRGWLPIVASVEEGDSW